MTAQKEHFTFVIYEADGCLWYVRQIGLGLWFLFVIYLFELINTFNFTSIRGMSEFMIAHPDRGNKYLFSHSGHFIADCLLYMRQIGLGPCFLFCVLSHLYTSFWNPRFAWYIVQFVHFLNVRYYVHFLNVGRVLNRLFWDPLTFKN